MLHSPSSADGFEERARRMLGLLRDLSSWVVDRDGAGFGVTTISVELAEGSYAGLRCVVHRGVMRLWLSSCKVLELGRQFLR